MPTPTATAATPTRRSGNFDKAAADYNEVIRLNPKDADAYRSRGVAYRDKGDLDKAIADYTEAIRLDPKRCRGLLQPRPTPTG